MQSAGKGARFGPDFQQHRPPAGPGGLSLDRMNRNPATGLQQSFAQGGPPPRPPASVGPPLGPASDPQLIQMLSSLTTGQLQMQQFMLRPQSAPPRQDRASDSHHGRAPKQLHALSLPDPHENWLPFKRKVAMLEADTFNATTFQKVRQVIAALPDQEQSLLRDFMSVPQMSAPDALLNLLGWLESRHASKAGAEELDVTKNFDAYQRSSGNFQNYVDTFEAHVQRLITIGEPLTEAQKRRFLIAKAALPEQAEAKLLSSLLQIRKCKGTTVDVYSDVKESLIALGKESNLFVKVNALLHGSFTQDHTFLPLENVCVTR